MIKKLLTNLGLFFGIIHEVKSQYLCVEYGCIIRKSVNCPEGMCTKHHLMWHRTVEWLVDGPCVYMYHCGRPDV